MVELVKQKHSLFFPLWVILFSFVLCQQTDIKQFVKEIPIVPIPLDGPAAESRAEFSGLAWYGEYLIMLPQYPERYDNHFFIIHQDSLRGFLQSGSSSSVTPTPLPVNMPDFSSIIPGYEGFEAIDFYHDRVFITIESETRSGVMGYLISGIVSPGLKDITLDINSLRKIPPQTHLPNFSEESLIIVDDNVCTIYEINSSALNERSVMHTFSMDGSPSRTIPFPSIEYRITDTTRPDHNNRFWVINYLWPGDGDDLNVVEDPLFQKYGKGSSHSSSEAVERLIQLEYTSNGIILTESPPILLQLEEGQSRNWEGIVRFQDVGFLLVTDKYPKTILAFVPYAMNDQR